MQSKLPLLHSCPGGVRKSTFHGPWQRSLSRSQTAASRIIPEIISNKKSCQAVSKQQKFFAPCQYPGFASRAWSRVVCLSSTSSMEHTRPRNQPNTSRVPIFFDRQFQLHAKPNPASGQSSGVVRFLPNNSCLGTTPFGDNFEPWPNPFTTDAASLAPHV